MKICTDRLFIRDIKSEDWRDLQAITSDFAQSSAAVYDFPLPTEDTAVQELAKRFADEGLFYAVCLPETGKMIGYVCFHSGDGNFDLGYCFHSEYQGMGYAFESCTAVMDEIRKQYNIKAFTAGTAIENVPSCALLKKLGFVLQNTERLAFHKDAEGKDIFFTGGNFLRTI